MALVVDAQRSSVTIETRARGMLAALAHDLRIATTRFHGGVTGEHEALVVFPVDGLVVAQARRHGSAAWGGRPEPDATTIEAKLRDEVFAGISEVRVRGELVGERASLSIETARGAERVEVPVTIERGAEVRVRGVATLSRSALGTGDPRVPLGAIKLDDGVRVEFDVVLREA